MMMALAVGAAFAVGFVTGALLLRRHCIHDWEPVVERELPSRAEELKKHGEDLSTWRSTVQLAEISSKTFFALVSCKKCGGVKEFTIKT
jgi:hypothetical protein